MIVRKGQITDRYRRAAEQAHVYDNSDFSFLSLRSSQVRLLKFQHDRGGSPGGVMHRTRAAKACSNACESHVIYSQLKVADRPELAACVSATPRAGMRPWVQCMPEDWKWLRVLQRAFSTLCDTFINEIACRSCIS